MIGSTIPIADNWNSVANKSVNDGTYVGFMVLMVTGGILSWLLVPPNKIVRADGSRVQHTPQRGMLAEMRGLYRTLATDPYILLLFPFFFASNMFYTYQQNAYNLYMFNTRSRAFTALFYWLAQIFSALMFGWFLDLPALRRRHRALAGWALLFTLVNVVWGGGLKAQLTGIARPPKGVDPAAWNRGMDVYDTDFTWYLLMYLFYGFLDAAWQTYAYWLMGALSNDPHKLAYFAGFYKVPYSSVARI